MRARLSRRQGTIATLLAATIAGCSLIGDLDDLSGAQADAAADSGSGKCVPGGDCSTCATCIAYCGCFNPGALDSCVRQCADGSAGLGGSSGSAGTGGVGGTQANGGGGGIDCTTTSDCQNCCLSGHPDGAQLYASALEQCMCATENGCATDCDSFCVQGSQPTATCVACAQTSQAVSDCFYPACTSAACQAYWTCTNGCQ